MLIASPAQAASAQAPGDLPYPFMCLGKDWGDLLGGQAVEVLVSYAERALARLRRPPTTPFVLAFERRRLMRATFASRFAGPS